MTEVHRQTRPLAVSLQRGNGTGQVLIFCFFARRPQTSSRGARRRGPALLLALGTTYFMAESAAPSAAASLRLRGLSPEFEALPAARRARVRGWDSSTCTGDRREESERHLLASARTQLLRRRSLMVSLEYKRFHKLSRGMPFDYQDSGKADGAAPCPSPRSPQRPSPASLRGVWQHGTDVSLRTEPQVFFRCHLFLHEHSLFQGPNEDVTGI